VWQAIDLAGIGRFDPTRFFAFFTIQSNLLAAGVLLALVMRPGRPVTPTLDLLRGAAALYLTITFFVVIFLLQSADVQVASGWVDFVVHKLSPIVVVVDWLVDPPRHRLTLRHAVIWLAYPLIWVMITIIRGAADGWYPYPFLDPANGGYGSVAVYFVSILVAFVGVGAGLVGLARWAGGGRAAPMLRSAD